MEKNAEEWLMYRQKLCIAILPLKMSAEEQLRLMKNTGFEGFFTGSGREECRSFRRYADEMDLEYQSIHAPFGSAARMWRGGEGELGATKELLDCVDTAAEVAVPIVVVHPYIGFEDTSDVTRSGLEAFRRVVEHAAEKNVQIAFENVEGEDYLAALMKEFREMPNVGFCWDTGHEQCYNRGKDMMALYGDRLIATHLNDNLGVSRHDGEIFWTDDLHLLPYDGITDWQSVADRINRSGFAGPLTFELGIGSKPKRHDNDKYGKLSAEEYLAEAYARACRLATMVLRGK
jgi:sugar phosphate isomerase/epimerase